MINEQYGTSRTPQVTVKSACDPRYKIRRQNITNDDGNHSSAQAGRQAAGRQAGRQAGKVDIKAQAVAVHRARHWRESTYILHGPSSPSIIAIIVVSIMTIRQVASDDGDNDDGHQDHDGDERGATRKIHRIHAPPKARSNERNSEPVI